MSSSGCNRCLGGQALTRWRRKRFSVASKKLPQVLGRPLAGVPGFGAAPSANWTIRPKTSVISKEFRERYLVNPKDPNAFEGRAIVFEGPEDYHERIDDPALNIDEHCVLFVRGTGPIGYPGGAEVVNMQPPAALIKRGIHSLPCIGDGRQSGTSGSPSILNASPEAAADGGLAILKTGDKVRVDLNKGSANILISEEELKKRRADLKAKGGFPYPPNQTPWQEIYRSTVGQQSTGACMELATRYHNIAGTFGVARDNH